MPNIKIKWILIFCFQITISPVSAQHWDEFLSSTLEKDWMAKHKFEEIIVYHRWANIKGKLKRKSRKAYIYSDSLGGRASGKNTPKIEINKTDSSTTECHTFPYNDAHSFCYTSVYKDDRKIRIEGESGTSYLKYDSLGRLVSIWVDNNWTRNNGNAGVSFFYYDNLDRIVRESRVNLVGGSHGNQIDDYHEFPISSIIESKWSYNEKGELLEVEIYKGKTFEALKKYRILRFSYDIDGIPKKKFYYHYENGAELLEIEESYQYTKSKK